MGLKENLTRSLDKATCDKTELNKIIMKWKKQFDEAEKTIQSGKKKK